MAEKKDCNGCADSSCGKKKKGNNIYNLGITIKMYNNTDNYRETTLQLEPLEMKRNRK